MPNRAETVSPPRCQGKAREKLGSRELPAVLPIKFFCSFGLIHVLMCCVEDLRIIVVLVSHCLVVRCPLLHLLMLQVLAMFSKHQRGPPLSRSARFGHGGFSVPLSTVAEGFEDDVRKPLFGDALQRIKMATGTLDTGLGYSEFLALV